MNNRDKNKTIAFRMRHNDKSYNEINKKTGIPKSTLSYWFKSLSPSSLQSPEAYALRWSKIRQKGADANKDKRRTEIKKIIKQTNDDISDISLEDNKILKYIISVLYWAEGAKSPFNCCVNFANTDPRLSALFITLLRKCFDIDETKIRIRLHLHYYHKINTTKVFWSKLLNVPLMQFNKIYIKPRSKTKRFRRNFMGICFIRYYDNNIKHKIMNIAYKVQKKIINLENLSPTEYDVIESS